MLADKKLTKLYYSIGEVAEIFGLSSSTLRYWEGEFSILKPKKNAKGERRYQIKDINIIDKIYQLVKVRGFTLSGAIKELSRKNERTDQVGNDDLLNRLLELRKKISDLEGKLSGKM